MGADSAEQKPLIGRSRFTARSKNLGEFAKNNIVVVSERKPFQFGKMAGPSPPLSSNGFRENVLHEKREKKVKFDVFPV